MKLTATDSILFEKQLIELGYKKSYQNFKNGDFTFWKSFEIQLDQYGERFGGYQIGFTFYDFSKFSQHIGDCPIHINYNFVLGGSLGIDRLDVTVTDDSMSIDKFEKFCTDFYQFWGKSKLKKQDLLYD